MRLGQVTSVTDTGRKRRHNEDAFVCDPPLFAIADGMGGAQAGEVASRLAANALREGDRQGEAEERVDELIQAANRRVFERSGEDESLSGMGTTMTVALVDGDRVVIGHVGDSRAYLLRGDALQQLTEDHSLVAELTRAGKLSEEEAETHPQRSVITRALGTDPDVDVDTLAVDAQPGDIFLLCSDGLTSMVADEEILQVVASGRNDLARAARTLVRKANRAGGEDNITILFFEVAAIGVDEETRKAPPPTADEADIEDTLSGAERVPVIRADEWQEAPRPRPLPAAHAEHRRRRRILLLGAALLAAAAIVGLGLFGLSQSHFVGAQKNGRVTVYQGLPWNLGAGIHLYRAVYVSPLLASQLTRSERKQLFDHSLKSYSAAKNEVKRYEHEVVP